MTTPGSSGDVRDAALEVLWQRALEAWDEDVPHAAVLEFALASDALPEIAGRYRTLKDDPQKGARAKKQIDAIVAAATRLMLATKTPRRTKAPPGVLITVIAICLVLLGYATYAMWHSMAFP